MQILHGATGAHVRERAWRLVGLGALCGDVDAPLLPFHDCGPEPLVRGGAGAEQRSELICERRRVACHDHVELARGAAEQQIAYGTADEREVLALAAQLEQRGAARLSAQRLQHLVAAGGRGGAWCGRHAMHPLPVTLCFRGAPCQPTRTGIPAAARCALASATV